MALPVHQKTWSQCLFNTRIPYVSLLATTGGVVTGTTNQLIVAGMTCVGSSNGTAAAMDGTDRCTTAAGFAVRATAQAAPQSWIAISDGVVQTLFSYRGSSDDEFRVSFSPGSLYVVAATPTHQPTASDEVNYCSSGTAIGTATSGDRILHVWVDSTHRLFRVAVMRAGIVVGKLWGTEPVDASHLVAPASAPVPVWGFVHGAGNTAALVTAAGPYSNQNTGGSARIVNPGTQIVNLGGSCLVLGGNFNSEDNVSLELNGTAPGVRAIGLSSNAGSQRGSYGNRYDWHYANDFQVCGALTADKKWVMLNDKSTATNGGLLWPWDSAVTSCTTT